MPKITSNNYIKTSKVYILLQTNYRISLTKKPTNQPHSKHTYIRYTQAMTTIHKLLFLILLTSITLMAKSAHAESLKSDNYTIRFGNFNITSGTKTSASYSLTDTVGQTAAGEFNSAGYTVKAGFQYIYTLFPFSFVISDLTIDFGTLTPSTFTTDTNTLTISAPGQGYTVTALEDHPLERSGSDQIPDTTCDGGTCTQTTAAVWTSTSIYGFGFNMSGNDIPGDFTNSTYFRQFADAESAESPATVMSSNSAGQARVATVTYKINSSASQAAGNYSNIINYVATPTF